jgi:hypothetical protein
MKPMQGEPLETYAGDLRERPLTITVHELQESRNRALHSCRIQEARSHLADARCFRGALPYPELQDEIEQEGEAIYDELLALIERFDAFSVRFQQRDSQLTQELYAWERTAP